MPFQSLVNAQQLEVVVAGPGDITRLYVCKGLAQGYFSVQAQQGQWQSASDTWQFGVGPQLSSMQFRRAIATVGFAGIQENEPGGGSVSWILQNVIADFDDDAGNVRVSVTSTLQVSNQGTAGQWSFAGVSSLAYDVSILAAVT